MKAATEGEFQLKLFPSLKNGDIYDKGREYLKENFLAILEKITEEARKGNLQAAKFLYPDISKLMEIEEPEINIDKELEKLPDEEWE